MIENQSLCRLMYSKSIDWRYDTLWKVSSPYEVVE
jgi:hypothetical protein